MCFKIILSIGCARICKGLVHLYTPALHLSKCQREGFSPVWCVHASHTGRKENPVAWRDCQKMGVSGRAQCGQSEQKNTEGAA